MNELQRTQEIRLAGSVRPIDRRRQNEAPELVDARINRVRQNVFFAGTRNHRKGLRVAK